MGLLQKTWWISKVLLPYHCFIPSFQLICCHFPMWVVLKNGLFQEPFSSVSTLLLSFNCSMFVWSTDLCRKWSEKFVMGVWLCYWNWVFCWWKWFIYQLACPLWISLLVRRKKLRNFEKWVNFDYVVGIECCVVSWWSIGNAFLGVTLRTHNPI